MNIDALNSEITNDPLGRGYAGFTDIQVADSLNNVKDRIPPGNPMISASKVINNINIAEFNALSDADETKFWRLMAIGELNPWGIEADILVSLFGGGSTTISNLQSFRNTLLLSRAQELSLGHVRVGHVIEARSL